jgi:hypothetical protein
MSFMSNRVTHGQIIALMSNHISFMSNHATHVICDWTFPEIQ